MAKKKLTIWNERMLELMKEALAREVVISQQDFCRRVGVHFTNITHIRGGTRSFTIDQILAAADLMNKPMDWFFDRSAVISATDHIREGLRILEENRKLLEKSLRSSTKKPVLQREKKAIHR